MALALAPETMEAHRARGLLLEATDNYEEAVGEFKAALAINDDVPDLWISLGLNYRFLGVSDQAIDAFTRANVLNPADPSPDLYISRTYAGSGDYEKALQYAEVTSWSRAISPTSSPKADEFLQRKGPWTPRYRFSVAGIEDG